MMNRLMMAVVGFIALGILLSSSVFIIYPWESGLVLQFGEVVDVRQNAGIYFKAPWHDVRRFDSRVLTIDTKDPDRFITTEKENVLVDSYIKWRISGSPAAVLHQRGRTRAGGGRTAAGNYQPRPAR